MLLRCRGAERLELELELKPRVVAAGLEARGKFAVCRGPLVYALESPPPEWGLDGAALVLDRNDPGGSLRVREAPSGGTRPWGQAIEADAVRLPQRSSFAVGGPPTEPDARHKVRLVPVVAAGIDGNRSVTEELSTSQMGHHLNNPAIPLPEYRTLLPVEWSYEDTADRSVENVNSAGGS